MKSLSLIVLLFTTLHSATAPKILRQLRENIQNAHHALQPNDAARLYMLHFLLADQTQSEDRASANPPMLHFIVDPTQPSATNMQQIERSQIDQK